MFIKVNYHKVILKNTIIKSPSYTWKIMNNFPLNKLEKTFTIADFERQLSNTHVKKIMNSILSNEFHDNIIRVVLKKSGSFEIIDGQHRIEAIARLRDLGKLTHYDLVLMIYAEAVARRTYRSINLAKALKMEDHLRALDNGRNQFFVKLRPYYVHYNDGNKPKFGMVLNALYYAKNGSPRAVSAQLLDRMFKSITQGDVITMIEFSRAMDKTEGFIPKKPQKMYKYEIYRNLFRIGYENEFDQSVWEQFIRVCKSDKVIPKYLEDKKMKSVKRIYYYMADQIGDKMGWKLKKIDRTNIQTRLVLNQPNSAPIQQY